MSVNANNWSLSYKLWEFRKTLSSDCFENSYLDHRRVESNFAERSINNAIYTEFAAPLKLDTLLHDTLEQVNEHPASKKYLLKLTEQK